jgi:PAS domain S-box-containing protein
MVSQEVSNSRGSSDIRVLVADDDPAILDVYASTLHLAAGLAVPQTQLSVLQARLFSGTSAGVFSPPCALTLCSQGDEAIEKIREAGQAGKPFAVAFLDVRMPPGLDGITTAERIRALDPNINIVIVTAYSDSDPVKIARRIPPPDKLLYLQKPLLPMEIRQSVSALGAKWHAQRLLEQAYQDLEKRVEERTAELAALNRQLEFDIAKRTQVEEALSASEVRYRAIFDAANDAILVYDGETGRISDANHRACEMFGYTVEELRNLRTSDLIAEESPRTEWAAAHALGRDPGNPQLFECRVREKSGRVFWVETSVRGAPDLGNCCILGVVRDITERKQAALERARLEEQLRSSQKMEAVGRLAGGVAHDFNNLLTAILATSDMVLNSLEHSHPLRLDINEIRRAAIQAGMLTRQLLAFSRKQVRQLQVVDLNEIVRNIEQILRRVIGEDIILQTALAPELSGVKADPGQLEQIVMNLAVNSRDAMPKGGVLSLETSEVSLEESHGSGHFSVSPGAYVMLAVTDTGTGISAEVMPHLFEPFFTTKGPGQGTGLGLATVYAIVKQSGGYIWVYSEPDKGTTFKIYLPKVEEPPQSLRKPAAAEPLRRGSETVLLVEDNEPVRILTGRVLRQYGYTVLDAPDGLQALDVIAQHWGPIHLMITDIVMPRMSGPELAKRLAAPHPSMKVLYMSGHADDAFLHHGAPDFRPAFLEKPFAATTLLEKVREVLEAPENDRADHGSDGEN